MAVNPAGFVPVFDRGAPFLVTGYAREVISGGQFVYFSGAADSVSSGLNSFATSDIKFCTGASGTLFNGVAVANVASGALVTVALEGVIVSRAAGAIVGGETLLANGADAVIAGTTAGTVVGRALGGASSGGYVMWKIGV